MMWILVTGAFIMLMAVAASTTDKLDTSDTRKSERAEMREARELSDKLDEHLYRLQLRDELDSGLFIDWVDVWATMQEVGL